MTPDRAMRVAWRWFIAGVIILAVRGALWAVGMDEFRSPLAGLAWLCLLFSVNYSGWARGYRDAGQGERDKGEAGDQGD